jgi:hypothetical protein
MAISRQGEQFRLFDGGRTPPMTRDTRRELDAGCSALSKQVLQPRRRPQKRTNPPRS